MDERIGDMGKKTVEVKYEIQMGQLMGIVIIGLILSIAAGFWLGKDSGFNKGFNQVTVEKPDYCTSDTSSGKVVVKCNELGNVSLDSLCKWVSPELKDKIKLVIVT
jgi:hypothetical protein